MHGVCVWAKPVPGLPWCGTCPDYDTGATPAEPTVDISLLAMLALLDRPPLPWPDGWESWPVTIQAHRLLLEKALAAPPPFHADRFEGRGVVIGAGGATYFACAMVVLVALRGAGCELPVEFWHLGAGEIDPHMRQLAHESGVECVDARAVAERSPRPPRILNGWELKPFSVLHSRFAEVLYLDADNVPAADPTALFDDPAYRSTGTIFWPDLPPAYRPEWLPHRVFEAAGLPPSDDPPFESGQLLVDKRRCWHELNAAMHLNEHSDFWYGRLGGADLLYGDKDTFWVAWHKAGTAYAQPRTPAGWTHPAIIQHDLTGRVLFQHCCRGKDPLATGAPIGCLSEASVVAAAGRALRQRWHGRPWDWADQTPEETALAEAVPGTYRYRRIGHDERPMELRPGGEVGVGAAGCERRWSVRLLGGLPTLVISGDDRATMFLRRDDAGAWVGRWEYHERMPVELRPAPG